MKAYSLAIAQAAENNEPDEPVTYTTNLTEEEKDAQKTKDMTQNIASDDGNEEIVDQLLNRASKKVSSFPFNLAQKRAKEINLL